MTPPTTRELRCAKKQFEASARLRAAAPELLAGLKQIVRKQETGDGDFSVAELCRTLIAKAEGRSK